jgi:hypothetical protein
LRLFQQSLKALLSEEQPYSVKPLKEYLGTRIKVVSVESMERTKKVGS